MLAAVAVGLVGVGVVAAPASAASTAVPAADHVLAAASYATSAFHDEWDYSNTADLLLDNSGPSMNVANASWSGGVLSYTAEPGSYVSPLWGGYPGSLYQNRDGALAANRITASAYDHISIHAYSSASVSSAIQWFDSPSLNSQTEGGQPFELLPGWHEYDIALSANRFPGLSVNWSGVIEGIRFATSPAANTTIKLDFMRLYKAGADASAQASWTVAGDRAQPYWSSTGVAACTAPSQTCGPVQDDGGEAVPAETGALTVDASAYPAGTTLFLAAPGGASPVVGSAVMVQPRPQPIVDTPSAAGCGDFATSAFGHPWLGTTGTFHVSNATNVTLSGGKLSATNTSNDPHVDFSTGGGIDASVWRYLSVTETYSGSFNLLNAPGGGTMARVMWANPGRALSQSQDLLTYRDRPTINVDLGIPAATLTESEAATRYGWAGPISAFRWDPNEDPGARTWSLSNITLGRACETAPRTGYTITWHDPGWVGGTTTTVQAVSQSDGSVHTLATVAEKSGENTLNATQAELPLGDYTIRVVSSGPTAGATASGASATPLRFTARTSRISGADRYATGVAASKAEYPSGAGTVLIASGANYPDALAAAPAAVAVGGPLLLTEPSRLAASVAAELKRLGPSKVYVIGGPSAVSAATLSQISRAAGVTAVRVSGADRFATSAAIAARFFPTRTASAFVATGLGFPDALSAASAAARAGAPVLLVPGTSRAPTGAVSAQLSRLHPSKILAVGGSAVISSAMLAALTKVAPTTQLSGADRFATSVAVGKAFPGAAAGTALLASGLDFPDALVGATLAGVRGTPLYLAQQGCVPASVNAELTRVKATSVTLVGGPAALSAAVADETRC